MSILNNILSDNPDTIEDIKNLKTDLNTLKNADIKTHSHNTSDITGLSDTLSSMSSPIVKLGEWVASAETSEATITFSSIPLTDYKYIKIHGILYSSNPDNYSLAININKSTNSNHTFTNYYIDEGTYGTNNAQNKGPTLYYSNYDVRFECTLYSGYTGVYGESSPSCMYSANCFSDKSISWTQGSMSAVSNLNEIYIEKPKMTKGSHIVVYGHK